MWSMTGMKGGINDAVKPDDTKTENRWKTNTDQTETLQTRAASAFWL